MNPDRPVATHVAVRGGRILGVGSLDDLRGWSKRDVDMTLADKVLMPGMVEGHSHAFEGLVWDHTYVGSYERRDPDGKPWPGVGTIEALIARLKEAEARLGSPDQTLTGWGFDPLFVERRLTAADLDRVSTRRPVVVQHASGHIINANSLVMERAGITPSTNSEFILRDSEGRLTGEFAGQVGRFMLAKAIGGTGLADLGDRPDAVRRFAKAAQMTGVTTATDLHNDLSEKTVETFRTVTAEDDFPIRLVPAFRGTHTREDAVAYVGGLQRYNSSKLRFGLVKLIADGSIQGFTARLRWPGYFNGSKNGLWYIAPDELKSLVKRYHEAGLQVHIHTNGDEATEAALDAIEHVLADVPRRDHRHTLQHCQMASAAQFRRMAALGVCVNLFANHIYYWGDAHLAHTMGPDRADRLDACATALATGVPFAMHSDAPVTPIGPLFTAWCAVNRKTLSGRVLGAEQRISVMDALRAMTLGAAYTLKMDADIGSIEVGKFADFAVLEDDPTEVNPEALKDVRIWGTVVGGRIFPAPRA
ncbi:MAG: amidohydrolase [Phreatobacter sp.]|nr:amidohydrolase [Phreatobacter sp.]